MKRELTLGIGAVAAVLQFLVTFQLDFLSAEQAAAVIVAVNAVAAVVAAWATKPIAPQVWTYLISALAGVLVAYGMDVSQEVVGQFTMAFLAVMAFIARNQVSPTPDAPQTGVLGNHR